MVTRSRWNCVMMLLAGLSALAWARPSEARSENETARPSFLKGEILRSSYDGGTDDLLTAGLGAAGLQSATPPGFANALDPTAAELRRRAIYTNYRALVDVAPGGGYGVFFGPGVPLTGGAPDPSAERIPGDEFIAFAGPASGNENVTLMVQVPHMFDPAKPCIVTAPSSGSRGIYGAIGTAGEWGLKRGCAVAYTDKGTGTGAHDLQNDKVFLITGKREDARVAGPRASFNAELAPQDQAAYNAAFPNRWAVKHAHSRQNPEKDWGRNVLQSVEFAFYVLNSAIRTSAPARLRDAPLFIPENTIVIASSVSNGGGASVRAAEQDKSGLIDAVVVSEPNVTPELDSRFAIQQGGGEPLHEHSRSLFDYATLLHVFQGCASTGQPGAPLNTLASPARCASLTSKGLLTANDPEGQAAEAQAIINRHGILQEQNVVQPSHWTLHVPQGIAILYANAYGRFPVTENLCGYSYGATDPTGNPIPLAANAAEILFATSSGIPESGGINIIANGCANGPKWDRACISPSTNAADQNLDGALCLRALATDEEAGRRGISEARGRVSAGIEQIRMTGNLGGRPTLFVTGRSDAVLAPNHTSRAYYGRNKLVEGEHSRLSYYEVLNAQHLDALNGLSGFKERFIPLHYYFLQAMNLMYAHLTDQTPLPPSQVVRTTPRAGGTPLAPSNIPDIARDPAEGDRIAFALDSGLGKHRLAIPE